MTANQEAEPVGASGQNWTERPGSVTTADCRERPGPGGSSTGQSCCQHINHAGSEYILDVDYADLLVVALVMYVQCICNSCLFKI